MRSRTRSKTFLVGRTDQERPNPLEGQAAESAFYVLDVSISWEMSPPLPARGVDRLPGRVAESLYWSLYRPQRT